MPHSKFAKSSGSKALQKRLNFCFATLSNGHKVIRLLTSTGVRLAFIPKAWELSRSAIGEAYKSTQGSTWSLESPARGQSESSSVLLEVGYLTCTSERGEGMKKGAYVFRHDHWKYGIKLMLTGEGKTCNPVSSKTEPSTPRDTNQLSN